MDAKSLRVPHPDLLDVSSALLRSHGLSEEDAAITAEHLVTANLRGVDTHGVIRLAGYIKRIQAGGNNPHPEIRILRQTDTTALMDGDNSLGQVGGKRAMELAIEKAERRGIGLVTMRNSNHYGMAGYYTLLAVQRDMIGISMTNVLAAMAPTGGTDKRIGNNPIAFAFPADSEPPVVVDFAASKSSWGKALLCAQSGEPLPEDCFTDSRGQPTRSAEAFLDGGTLVPIASHKGYGLALAISLLTGLLADAEFDTELPHLYKEPDKPGGNSFTMGAIRIDSFQPVDRFKKHLDSIVRQVRSSGLVSGAQRVYLPGEIEHEREQEQRTKGILMKRQMVEELIDLAKQAGLNAAALQKLLT
jgi:LDH2 family malate/lactate/ureidoglycolate dehydrogenase